MNMNSVPVFKTEQVKSEMEYVDEPMDTNETLDDFCEEGEINSSDDEPSASEHYKTSIPSIFTRNKNSSLNFSVNNDEELRKEARAKRFAIPMKPSNEEVFNEQLNNLYRDLGIDKENERHYRFNAIHLRGTENMSTEDVMDYFASYTPSHIEWINDVSCNVVWMDDISAARALLSMSKRIKHLDKVHLNANPFEKDFREAETIIEENMDDDSIDARYIKTAIPPGFWRMGIPSDKSNFILLRYATRSDKKQKHAEKNSEYYKKYGNPNYGNLPGILSKSLRSEFKKSKSNDSNSIWKRSTTEKPSLDEKKNPWEELAFEWGKTDKVEENDLPILRKNIQRSRPAYASTNVPDLRVSLTNKHERRKRERILSGSPNSSDREIWETKTKVPRMKMYADDEEKKLKKESTRNLHGTVSHRKSMEDLRSKISAKKNRTRFKFRAEKEEILSGESNSSENEYEDGDTGDWALEQYYDLRESIGHNKKYQYSSEYQSESEGSENDKDEKFFKSQLGHISPLQIEIDNDEYYQRKKKG